MPRPCPLCENSGATEAFPYETRWSGRSFFYFHCEHCGCTFVDPVPTSEEFERMYATDTYHDVHYSDTSTTRHDDSVRFLEEHASRGARVLDFGCGNGAFMKAARQAGFEVFGVEHSERAAANLAARTGLDISPLQTRLQQQKTFDVIHLGDVLEHLPEPARVIRDLERLLSPRGVFFIEGPLQAHDSLVYFAAAGFGRLKQRVGRASHGTSPPTHLFLATERSQREFFTRLLRHRLAAFEVWEDGWPYLHRGPAGRGAGPLVRKTIGRLAVAASRLPGLRARLGNRFRTITIPSA